MARHWKLSDFPFSVEVKVKGKWEPLSLFVEIHSAEFFLLSIREVNKAIKYRLIFIDHKVKQYIQIY